MWLDFFINTCHVFQGKSIWARIWQKVPYGCDNQNLAIVMSVKYYLLRAFPENLKQINLQY